MTSKEREDYLVSTYGECVRATKAAHIIGRSPETVRKMMKDGRLDAVCGGKMVCMHSVARYIDAPRQEDFKARIRRSGRKWAVM